jgi:hypothetical protein
MAAYFRHISRTCISVTSLVASIFFLSCEEVINLDLDQVKERIVIEGIVSDKQSASKVKLSFTQSIYTKSPTKSTSGATVTLRDDLGNSEVLQEVQPGIFTPAKDPGAINREYTLTVVFGGTEYSATSRMPEAMTLDSVRTSGTNSWFSYQVTLTYYLTNKKGVEEFCLLRAYNLNDSKFYWTLYSDKNSDGRQVALGGPSFLATGNTIRVELISIDKPTYDYFRSLQQLAGTDGFEAPDLVKLSDYNPQSNISNNALGYFSAQAQRDYVVTLH